MEPAILDEVNELINNVLNQLESFELHRSVQEVGCNRSDSRSDIESKTEQHISPFPLNRNDDNSQLSYSFSSMNQSLLHTQTPYSAKHPLIRVCNRKLMDPSESINYQEFTLEVVSDDDEPLVSDKDDLAELNVEDSNEEKKQREGKRKFEKPKINVDDPLLKGFEAALSRIVEKNGLNGHTESNGAFESEDANESDPITKRALERLEARFKEVTSASTNANDPFAGCSTYWTSWPKRTPVIIPADIAKAKADSEVRTSRSPSDHNEIDEKVELDLVNDVDKAITEEGNGDSGNTFDQIVCDGDKKEEKDDEETKSRPIPISISPKPLNRTCTSPSSQQPPFTELEIQIDEDPSPRTVPIKIMGDKRRSLEVKDYLSRLNLPTDSCREYDRYREPSEPTSYSNALENRLRLTQRRPLNVNRNKTNVASHEPFSTLPYNSSVASSWRLTPSRLGTGALGQKAIDRYERSVGLDSGYGYKRQDRSVADYSNIEDPVIRRALMRLDSQLSQSSAMVSPLSIVTPSNTYFQRSTSPLGYAVSGTSEPTSPNFIHRISKSPLSQTDDRSLYARRSASRNLGSTDERQMPYMSLRSHYMTPQQSEELKSPQSPRRLLTSNAFQPTSAHRSLFSNSNSNGGTVSRWDKQPDEQPNNSPNIRVLQPFFDHLENREFRRTVADTVRRTTPGKQHTTFTCEYTRPKKDTQQGRSSQRAYSNVPTTNDVQRKTQYTNPADGRESTPISVTLSDCNLRLATSMTNLKLNPEAYKEQNRTSLDRDQLIHDPQEQSSSLRKVLPVENKDNNGKQSARSIVNEEHNVIPKVTVTASDDKSEERPRTSPRKSSTVASRVSVFERLNSTESNTPLVTSPKLKRMEPSKIPTRLQSSIRKSVARPTNGTVDISQPNKRANTVAKDSSTGPKHQKVSVFERLFRAKKNVA